MAYARLTDVDFSYKDNATRVYYDVEVLSYMFSIVFATRGLVHIVVALDHEIEQPDESAIIEAAREVFSSDIAREHIGDDVRFAVELLDHTNDDDVERMRTITSAFIHGLSPFGEHDGKFYEFVSWNGSNYDLPMMCVANLLSNPADGAINRVFSPGWMRLFSDVVINNDAPSWKLYNLMEECSAKRINARELQTLIREAVYSDAHIDIAKIARSQSAGDETRFPPGLKMEGARYGELDIIVDESVVGDGFGVSSDNVRPANIVGLIGYNCNDVLITMVLGRHPQIVQGITIRDDIRELYPYTSARAITHDKIAAFNNYERDCTVPDLAAQVIIGPHYMKPKDIPTVSYDFPINGKVVDLLDYMNEHENMPDDAYVFFDHFRGRDTTTFSDDFNAKRTQPITHGSTINVPYYRDGRPIDAYICLSTGGAHGSIMAGLSQMSPDEVYQWTRSDVGAASHQKPTVDMRDVVHIDWSSFYPTMQSKLGAYSTAKGVDPYTEILNRRLEIKASLPHTPKSEWDEGALAASRMEQALKLLLNSPTGKSNTHKKYAKLPLDNRTLSMRLCGNMHIWCMGQRLVEAGGFILATNTDGVYVANLSMEECQTVIDGYIRDYDMPVEPEYVERYINRDTSNRVEFKDGVIDSVGGRLAAGNIGANKAWLLGKKVAFPTVVAEATLAYMRADDWLSAPYERERMAEIVDELFRRDLATHDLSGWWHIHAGTMKRRLVVGGQILSKINRVVLSTRGLRPQLRSVRKLKKAQVEGLLAHVWPKIRDLDIDGVSGREVFDYLVAEGLCPAQNVDVEDDRRLSDRGIFANSRLCVVEKGRRGALHVVGDMLEPEHVISPDSTVDEPVFINANLGLVNENDPDKVYEIKVWQMSDAVTGYPAAPIELLNTAKSVADFDMEYLDLAGYVDWAEQLLFTWKITADVPEIGCAFIDDPALSKASGQGKRMTKADIEAQTIRSVLSSVYGIVDAA